jgi:hypothetical protein
MVGFAFVNKIENLEERVSKHNRRVQKQKQTDKNSAMFEMFVLLRDRFFVQFRPRSTVSIAGFHNVFGYNAFVKLLVARATKTERLKLHLHSSEDKDDRKKASKAVKPSEKFATAVAKRAVGNAKTRLPANPAADPNLIKVINKCVSACVSAKFKEFGLVLDVSLDDKLDGLYHDLTAEVSGVC